MQFRENNPCLTSARNRLINNAYCNGTPQNTQSSHSVKMSLLYPGFNQTNLQLNDEEVVQFQKEFRAQQRDHEKKEALYEQKIQLLELEMKDL